MKRLEIVEKEAVGENYLIGTFGVKVLVPGSWSTLSACDLGNNRALHFFPCQKAKWDGLGGNTGWNDSGLLEAQSEYFEVVWGSLVEILPKWLLPTRLETRTKESNNYASLRVQKPMRLNESEYKMPSFTAAASTDPDLLRWVWVRAYLLGPERWWTILE